MVYSNAYRVGEVDISRVTEQVAELPLAQLFPDHRVEMGDAQAEARSIHS